MSGIPLSSLATNVHEAFGGLGMLCPHSNLISTNNGANPTYQVDVSADALILENTNGERVRVNSFSETIDLTVSGANGLIGSSEAADVWYHKWGAYNSTTQAITAFFHTTDDFATALAAAPAGYDYIGYLGAVFNVDDGGGLVGDFIGFKQKDNVVSSDAVQFVNAATQTSWASKNLSAAIPTTAKTATGIMGIAFSAAASRSVKIASDSSGRGEQWYSAYFGGSSATLYGTYSGVPVTTAQTLYMEISSATNASFSAYNTGWTY